MSARATNLALLAGVPALVLTGFFSWAFAAPAGPAFIALHRAVAAGLLIVLAWKYGVAQRSVARRVASRRASSLVVGALASTALLLTLGLGLAWTVGLITFDRPLAYSLLNVHVFAGVALLPVVIAHAAQRRRHSSSRLPFDRRDALRAIGALAGGVVLAALLDRVDGSRRDTGSRSAGTSLPVTSWTFDAVPSIDPAAWTLEVIDTSRRLVTAREIAAVPTIERDATLDCTSGWASTQTWRGIPLRSFVPEGRGARVTSVTGHTAAFAANEVDDLLLATHVGSLALTAEHGAPARLVAPLHRGYAWVKWVSRIEVL